MAEIDEQVLEGLYLSIEDKIEEIKGSLSEELQASHELMESTLKESIESVMNEVRYITQQNSAIYDLNKADLSALKEDVDKITGEQIENAIGDLREQLEALQNTVEELKNRAPVAASGEPVASGTGIDDAIESIGARVQLESEALKDELMGAMAQLAVTMTPENGDGGIGNQQLDNISEQIHAEVDAMKDELMEAMAQLAMTVTPESSGGADNSAALSAMSAKMQSEMLTMKDDLMGAMAQLAMTMTPESSGGGADNTAALSAMSAKIQSEMLTM